MTDAPGALRIERVGLVVHPTRDLATPLGELCAWAGEHGVEIVQVATPGIARRVAEEGDPATCDLLVSIGGDGTMLAALRAGIPNGRPALGIACGSLGVLTRVQNGEVAASLDRFAAGDWIGQALPALVVRRPDGPEVLALNDVAIIRAGIGQIRVAASADGVMFNRLAGDGVIVCTPLGSSAYSLAAGGPLLGLDAAGFVLTPLATHGGTAPPLVLGAANALRLEIGLGFGGARLEVDGQIDPVVPETLEIGLRPGVARLVGFVGQESPLTVLRRRGILVDSPRIVAEELRLGHDIDA